LRESVAGSISIYLFYKAVLIILIGTPFAANINPLRTGISPAFICKPNF